MRRLVFLCVVSVASLWLATGALAAPPWESASAARLALSDAEAAIILGDPAAVQAKVDTARGARIEIRGFLLTHSRDLGAVPLRAGPSRFSDVGVGRRVEHQD